MWLVPTPLLLSAHTTRTDDGDARQLRSVAGHQVRCDGRDHNGRRVSRIKGGGERGRKVADEVEVRRVTSLYRRDGGRHLLIAGGRDEVDGTIIRGLAHALKECGQPQEPSHGGEVEGVRTGNRRLAGSEAVDDSGEQHDVGHLVAVHGLDVSVDGHVVPLRREGCR